MRLSRIFNFSSIINRNSKSSFTFFKERRNLFEKLKTILNEINFFDNFFITTIDITKKNVVDVFNSQTFEINFTIIKKTSIEKIIYDDFINSSNIMILNNVTQTIINTTVNVEMNKIFQRLNQKLNERFQIEVSNMKKNFQRLNQIITNRFVVVDVENETQNHRSQFQNNNNDDFNQRFHVNEVNFFDLYLEKKFVFDDFSMNNFDKNHIFRNVYVFLNHVKIVIFIKKWKFIRIYFFLCLRYQVQIWYVFELTNEKRRLFKYDNELNEWIIMLIIQFRQFLVKVMKIVIEKTYNYENDRKKREFKKYVQIVTIQTLTTHTTRR